MTAVAGPTTYVRKENKQTMTDLGKYTYSDDPTSGASTLKEFSLRRNLEESELAQ